MKSFRMFCALFVIFFLTACGISPQSEATPQATQAGQPASLASETSGAAADNRALPVVEQNAQLTSSPAPIEPPPPPVWLPKVEASVEYSLAGGQENLLQVAEGVQISVPPGVVDGTLPALVVANVSNPAPFDGFETLDLYQVTLGEYHRLAQPLKVAFQYDPALLNPEIPAESQLTGALFDEETRRWTLLPVAVDEAAHTAAFQTDHLSLLGLFYMFKYIHGCPSEHFDIWYDEEEVLKITGNMQSFDDSQFCSGHANYIRAAAAYLEQAYTAYSQAGFKLPAGKISVVVASLPNWSDDPQYDTLTGRILLPTDDWNDLDALRHAAAHELFHVVQYQEMPLEKYLLDAWWMEATADYAADKVAWENSAWNRTNKMGQGIKQDYLRHDIEESGKHAYANAFFVDYLLNQAYAFPSFRDLWVSTNTKNLTIVELENQIQANLGQTWGEMYKGFAGYMIFEPESPLPIGSAVWENATSDRAVISTDAEINATIIQHASALFGIKTDAARFYSVEWLNANEGQVYVAYSLGDERSGAPYMQRLYPNQKSLMPLRPEDAAYVLLINPTGSGDLDFKIEITESKESLYTLNLFFDTAGDGECASYSSWGTALYWMRITENQVTIAYDSAKDDPWWYGPTSEHTIYASGSGTVENGIINASFESNDQVQTGTDDNGNPIVGHIAVQGSFTLSPNPDLPFYWNTDTVKGTSSVNLPPKYDFAGYQCSGVLKSLSAAPAQDFPAPPKATPP